MVHQSPWRTTVLSVGIAVVFGVASLSGQTAQLRGRVLDSTGRVLPGASLQLTSLGTGVGWNCAADELGGYQFNLLPPGRYSLAAAHPGFRESRVEELRLEVDSPLTLDLTLELGDIGEAVTVVGSQPLLNRVDGTTGNPVTPEQILNVPLNARDLTAAVSLQPGVTQAGAVSGARPEQSNLTLDGIDVNDDWAWIEKHGGAFYSVLRVTPDSIQEFRVVTSSPGASQGRSSGAQVSLITRSGTNQWHGAVYEYHRNAATAANNFFNNRITSDPDQDGKAGIARSNLIRNLFGGRVGGPIVRDKAFFFLNYEVRKDRSENTVLRLVPLSHLGEGKMRYLGSQGQVIEIGPAEFESLYPATGGVNPAAVKVFADAARRYPANDFGVGDQFNTGGYRFNASAPLDWHTATARLDFTPADGHSFLLRGNFQWDVDLNPGMWPDTPSPRVWFHPLGLTVGHSWVVSPSLVNSFRYGLTRQAWTYSGDQDQDAIYFREVFQRRLFNISHHTVATTHHFTEDLSWTRGRHTLQFGGQVRATRRFGSESQFSFDYANTNYMFYQPGSLDTPLRNAGLMYGPGHQFVFRKAATNLLGRFPMFSARYLYGPDGAPLADGSLRERAFLLREAEAYLEDSWQVRNGLTLNLGCRWSVSPAPWESLGYQVQPTIPLSRYLQNRQAGAARGIPYNELIQVDRAGPVYDRPGYFPTDWNNFSPRVSFAYSPQFSGGFAGRLFGTKSQSVVRGGFAVQYDRLGPFVLVVAPFNQSLGFQVVQDGSYFRNVTDQLGALFTGHDQDIRSLMPDPPPERLTFPRAQPADGAIRLEGSIDDSLTTPIHYNWNLSLARELPGGLLVELAWVSRKARRLPATRDVVQYNNLVDPGSGMDWYTAASLLYQHRTNNTPISEIPAIPYFENLFPKLPGNASLTPTQRIFSIVSRNGSNYYSWVDIQQAILNGSGIHPDMFVQPQYQTLATYSNIARSDYHALTATVRKRFAADLTFDLNYTWSRSMDNASASQTSGAVALTAMVPNAFDPDAIYAVSDFHLLHMVNANWIWRIPFGRGSQWGASLPSALNALAGGWHLSGIVRWNTGLPIRRATYEERYSTTRQFASSGIRARDPKPAPGKAGTHPNYWADPQYAYNSFRDCLAGEVGERNVFLLPDYFALDVAIRKTFSMPWREGHQLSFACEAFNVTNTQPLGGQPGWSLGADPLTSPMSSGFGNMTAIQGAPREIQFSLRYDF